jgi:hypothetical protein
MFQFVSIVYDTMWETQSFFSTTSMYDIIEILTNVMILRLHLHCLEL